MLAHVCAASSVAIHAGDTCPLSTVPSPSGPRRLALVQRDQMHRRRGTAITARALFDAFRTSAFTTTDAAAIGVSRDRLSRAVSAGHVRKVRHGLFLMVTQSESEDYSRSDEHHRGQVDAAIHAEVLRHFVEDLRARGTSAVVGGESAALLWGLPVDAVSAATILVPRGSRTHKGMRAGRWVRECDPDESDVAELHGLPVTTPIRTGVDLARNQPRHRATGILGLSLRRHGELLIAGRARMDAGDLTEALADPRLRAELAGRLDRQAMSQRVRVCAALADPRPETFLEGISWGRMTGWKLGALEPQKRVQGESGRWYRVDVYCDGVVGEADGAVKYLESKALWKEKLRQEDIEGAGHPVVRWTFGEVEHRPDVLKARWRAALRRHRG